MVIVAPFFICVLFFPMLTISQVDKNITSSSSLIAGDLPSSWLSPSKDFAFGFQEIEPGNFLLAIWFDKIPEKTITWSTNRNHPAPRGSVVEFTSNRGLILTDQSGQEIWRAALAKSNSSAGLTYAAMLDTGNFILATQTSAVLWQSFDEPTDTLLATQSLHQDGRIIARYSERNYSSGRFMFTLRTNGNPGLYTTNYPLFNTLNNPYWQIQNSGVGYQVVFNQSGFVYLVSRNGTILSDIIPNQGTHQALYQRVVLDYDGILRHSIYPKGSSSGWVTKSFIPDNICWDMIEQTGSGVCGYNSYCKLGNDTRAHCLCPPNYSLLDPNNEMSGCKKDFLPQTCDEEKDNFDFKVLHDVDWPLADYEHYQNVTKEWCREVCLVDCFCDISVFRDGGECWKKKLPLSNGKSPSQAGRTAFLKVRIHGGFNEKHGNSTKKVLIALLGTSGFGNIVLLGIILAGVSCFVYRQNKAEGDNQRQIGPKYNNRKFTYKELNQATNGFKEELGRGAFGVVYKGTIAGDSGSQIYVAVKKLDSILQDSDREFKAEVNAIGHTHHKNLVRLIGFCEQAEHRLLVYEYMSNGTLSDYLYGSPKPAWEKRVRIVQDIARGLLYLHDDCSNRIIHCDIKPQNILLDEDHNARISDFGLAKLLGLDQTQTNTAARGTRGYVAPEWFKNMPITAKVDVYSFGIMLLEIVCCRKNVDNGSNEEEDFVLLTDTASDCCQMNNIEALVKDDPDASSDFMRLERLVKVSLWCIQEDPGLRPTMRMVVEMIEGLVKVPEPPFPTSYSTTLTL